MNNTSDRVDDAVLGFVGRFAVGVLEAVWHGFVPLATFGACAYFNHHAPHEQQQDRLLGVCAWLLLMLWIDVKKAAK
jgi:hypothetical protein